MFGFPLVNLTGIDRPLAFPARAYFSVWNEYYRDETLQTKLDISTIGSGYGSLRKRCWRKDYFTSALPWQQRGVAPALPVSGTTSAVWPDSDFVPHALTGEWGYASVRNTTADTHLYNATSAGAAGDARGADNLRDLFNHNTVDLSSATSVNISDLRLSVQIQNG